MTLWLPILKLKFNNMKLTQSQDNVVFVLEKYPNDMIMFNGWITGGHGIQFDMGTVNSLTRKGIIINGKLSTEFKAARKNETQTKKGQ